MKASYAVLWRAADGEPRPGRLEPEALGVRFVPDDGTAEEDLRYEDIAGIRIADFPTDGPLDRTALALELRSGRTIHIDSIVRLGLVADLARSLTALTLAVDERPTRALVVAPLREGRVEAARALLDAGPPFAPGEAGLDRHEAFLTDREVIFLFEAARGGEPLSRLLASVPVWDAAPAWRDLIAGPPRVAELRYAWEATELAERPAGP